MVKLGHRSGTLRKVFRKTPGGRIVTHFMKRKPSSAKCGDCGNTLAGVPRERPYKMKSIPKTKKRPERPFGGVLCSTCSRRKIISRARESA